MKGVLKAAAETFGLSPKKGPSGRGYGVACGIDAGTSVAAIAEVVVDKATGEVKVKRIVCAQDMGLVVNPEGAKMQMEGSLFITLDYALKETLRFENGDIFDRNFDTYQIPRFSWGPKIETVIVDNQQARRQGGGEPAVIIVGGMPANAIYDAIGGRMFQMPMTPDRIKGVLRRARD